MAGFKRLEERYRNDPAFNQLVNVLINVIESLALAPSEVREAAMFAVIKFEMYRPITELKLSELDPEVLKNMPGSVLRREDLEEARKLVLGEKDE